MEGLNTPLSLRVHKHIKKEENGCWNWTKAKDKDGYGITSINGKSYRAHRVFYELYKEKIKSGFVIDHVCRNRSCVNPEHLREVTSRVNILFNSEGLASINSRKTHCSKGHIYNLKNTRVTKQGGRWCRVCDRLRGNIRKGVNRLEERRRRENSSK